MRVRVLDTRRPLARSVAALEEDTITQGLAEAGGYCSHWKLFRSFALSHFRLNPRLPRLHRILS